MCRGADGDILQISLYREVTSAGGDLSEKTHNYKQLIKMSTKPAKKGLLLEFYSKTGDAIRHFYGIVAVATILISVWLFAATEAFPEKTAPYISYIQIFEYLALSLFTIEYVIRFICAENKMKYIKGYDGVIDLVAILPSLIEIFFSFGLSVTWIRVLRLARLARMFKALKYNSWIEGIAGQVLPFILLVFGIEAMVLAAEANGLWSTPKDLNASLGVVGFSVAVMLGAKLSVVNSRIYAIEDSICRLVGSMRDMWETQAIREEIISWSHYLEHYITSPRSKKLMMASHMRDETDLLESKMEANSIGGPNSAGFHRDAAFIIHRSTVSTPKAYDDFLKTVVCLYMIVIIISVPGVPGLLASMLSVFVIGGMYCLVGDMDNPLSFQKGSFINARIDALAYWNKSHNKHLSDKAKNEVPPKQ